MCVQQTNKTSLGLQGFGFGLIRYVCTFDCNNNLNQWIKLSFFFNPNNSRLGLLLICLRLICLMCVQGFDECEDKSSQTGPSPLAAMSADGPVRF